jgi:hypothetical protein
LIQKVFFWYVFFLIWVQALWKIQNASMGNVEHENRKREGGAGWNAKVCCDDVERGIRQGMMLRWAVKDMKNRKCLKRAV